MRKFFLWTFISLFFLLLIIYSFFWRPFLDTPLVPPDQSIHYVLKPGSSIKTLATDLNQMGFLPNPRCLIVLSYLKGATQKLKAGEYLFSSGTTPEQLLNQIVAGKVIYHKFTIVEGWTFKQVLNALARNPDLKHTITDANAIQLLNELNLSKQNPEGLFLPATYYFEEGTTDISILQIAHQNLLTQLQKEWDQQISGLPYSSSYQALIAASLVEKETAKLAERPMVAGVIQRRLQQHMPLQIDSSVIYGLGGDYKGKLHRADLRRDTPYNTYVHRGLPPTPIGMPSLASLHAVFHPDNSDTLYFVAKGDGSHQFSVTLNAQNQAVNTYQINKVYPPIGLRNQTHFCRKSWYLPTSVQLLLTTEC